MPGTGEDSVALAATAEGLSIQGDGLAGAEDAAERAADAALDALDAAAGLGAGAADGGGEDLGSVDLGPEAEAAMDQFQELYKDAYLSRALLHFDEFVAAHPAIPPAALAARLKAAHGIDLEVLRARAELVRMGLHECAEDEGWRLITDDPNGLRLHSRCGPQTPTTHCFKSACELDCEMHELLSMAREFDLVPTWNSYITQTDILQISSLVELLVYASVWMPWPFAERDVLIQAVGIDMLAEDGSLAISFSSPDGGLPDGLTPPAGYEARTHVQVLPGSCLRLCPLPPKAPGGKGRTRVVVVTMLDSGAWVPEAVITFVLQVFAPFFLTAVQKVIASSFHDPSDPLPSRIEGHPELYAVMRERVDHFLSGHADAP